MKYDEKVLVHISDSAIQLLLLTWSIKIKQPRKVMFGYEILIQNGTYQYSINPLCKQ